YFKNIIAGTTGKVYGGTVYWGPDGMEKPGKLYLFERDGTAQIVEDGVQLANGLGFSPDDRTLYFADSAVRTIYAYDVQPATGALSNRRPFGRIPVSQGLPGRPTV